MKLPPSHAELMRRHPFWFFQKQRACDILDNYHKQPELGDLTDYLHEASTSSMDFVDLMACVAVLKYEAYGSQMFVLGDAMYQAFEEAKYKDMTWDMVGLPYEAQFLRFETPKNGIIGVYIMETNTTLDAGGKNVTIVAVSGPRLVGRTRRQEHYVSGVGNVSFYIQPDARIADEISARAEAVVDTDEARYEFVSTIKSVVGFLMYMACKNKDLSEVVIENQGAMNRARKNAEKYKGQRRGLAAEALVKTLPQTRITYIAPKLEKEYARVLKDSNRTGAVPHWVSGHPRRVRFGPGRTLSEMRWIEAVIRRGRQYPKDAEPEKRAGYVLK